MPITVEPPKQRSEPTIYSSLIAQSRFHVISNGISDRLLSSPTVCASEALTLNAVLGSWAATLPWYFQLDQPTSLPYDWYLFARQKVWWRYWNLQILLTRPQLLTWAMRRMGSQQTSDDTPEEAKCRKICLDSAHRTITTANAYIRETALTRLMSWYTLYVLLKLAYSMKMFRVLISLHQILHLPCCSHTFRLPMCGPYLSGRTSLADRH